MFAADADLSIPIHSHDPAQSTPNTYITYSFTIHNNGITDDATNASVTVASAGSQFFDSGSPYFFSNNGDGTFTASVGTVPAGTDATFTVRFFAQRGAVSVTATVSSPDDPDSSNNSATETTNATMPTADLEMASVTVSPVTAVVGDIRHYHGVITNNGPDTATAVGVGFQPDDPSSQSDTHETFLTASPSPSPAAADQNGLRSIPLGDIPASGSVTFDVYYTATSTGFFQRNFYTITSGGQTDPNTNDNYKTVFSTINGSGTPASTLFVNGSPAPSSLTPDMPIVFESYRNNDGAVGGHVQYSLDGGTSWANLNDGSQGLMAYNYHDSRYVLTTESYPIGSNIYFRSDAVFSDQSEQASEAVGPFNITSNETHLAPTTFKIEGATYPFNVNYPSYPLNFEAATSAQANGLTVQLQFSVTPEVEASWTAVDNGNSGYLTNQGGNNYLLKTNAYPTGSGIYFRAVTAAAGYAESISNVIGPFTLPGDPGARPMTFTVNGNEASTSNLADTVLQFAAIQTGTSAGLSVRVQYNTGDPSWTDLDDNNGGRMIFDVSAGGSRFVLNTTSYPLATNVSFRAVASAHGYPDQFSNIVGTFDLGTTSSHLLAPTLYVKRNTTVADFEFRVGDSDTTPSLSIRIQQTTTPGVESSWTDLPDGNGGQLAPRSVAGQFYLLANQLPAVKKTYFRAIASAGQGSVNGISSARGVFTIIPHTPPRVTLTPPAHLSGSGDGSSPNSRLLVAAGPIDLKATAQSARTIIELGVKIDGLTRYSVSDGSKSIDYVTSYIDLGDRALEAYAIDDLLTTSRIPTVIYIRVVPAPAAELKRKSAANGGTAAAAQATADVFTLVKDNAVWSDPEAWRTSSGQQGVPGANDFAIVPRNLSVTLSGAPVTVKSLSINGLLIGNGFDFTVTGILTMADQSSIVSTHLIIASNGEADLINSTAILLGNTTVDNYGKWLLHGSGSVVQLAGFNGSGMTNFQRPLTPAANPGYDVSQSSRVIQAHSQPTSGIITGLNPDALLGQSRIGLIGGGVISNDGGTVISNDGGTVISNDGGTVISNDGGTLISQDGNGLIGQDGNGLISQDGNGLISQDGNSLIGQDGNGLIGQDGNGIIKRNAQAKGHPNDVATSGIVITGGEVNLNAVTLIGPVEMTGGILSGTGLIQGNLTNDSGYIMPGHSPGTIAVTGDFVQGNNGTIVLENGGPLSGQFDEVQINGTAQLGGKLELKTINGYMPLTSNSFSPISYNTATGSFASVTGNAGVTARPNGLVFTDDVIQPNPKTGQPLNISTRMSVQTGDNALIGGFIITGTSSKKVLIRAIGPSLPVSGALADPVLELHQGDGTVITNDNWRDSQQDEIVATTIPPSSDLEAAIVATLPPGAHTAIVRGKGTNAGVGLVEVYDLDSTGPAQLANISTRGNVLTGDNVMIGGFIVGGNEPARVLVRAIGPSLANSGVQGALSDPMLEIHDGNGNVISNDDWRETQEAEILATTIPPTDNREAAIVATLAPGAYTAIVRGKDDSTGIAVVEAYNLQ